MDSLTSINLPDVSKEKYESVSG